MYQSAKNNIAAIHKRLMSPYFHFVNSLLVWKENNTMAADQQPDILVHI